MRSPQTIPTSRTAACGVDAPAVEIAGLGKSYGGTAVLDSVELSVARGTVFALLGPNGSGKTTTVRILSTLLAADSGTARVLGHDVRTDAAAVRAAIGVTGQFSAVDDLLTGRENLGLVAALHHLPRRVGRERTDQLLTEFDLLDSADRVASTYSGGMKRRLDLAMTLMARPEVLFLDEPTTGLDPRSRRGLWEVVRELVRDGVTVFLTTQYLEEADSLAGRVALLDRGKVVAEGTPAELKRRVPGGHLRLEFHDDAAVDAAARAHPAATRDPDAPALSIPTDGGLASLRAVLDGLDDRAVAGLSLHTPDLDDVFLALTGRPAEVTP